MLSLILFTICACGLWWLLQKWHDRVRCLPPGPFRFPLIGCIPQILMLDNVLPFIAFKKLSKIYNSDIVYIQIGAVKAVAINGLEANKEILTNEDWLGRNQEKWMLDRGFGRPELGLVHGNVEQWREARRFCAKTLREFGFGVKKKMDEHLQEQLTEIIGVMRKSMDGDSGVIQAKHLFDLTMLNATFTLVNGKPFDRDDRRLPELFAILDAFFKSCALGAGLLTAYPFLVDIAPKLVKFDLQHAANEKFHQFFRELIDDVRAAGVYKEDPSTFIEVFLQKIEQVQKVDPGNVVFSEENLITILYDFFLGATETTTNTMSMSVAYLIRYPEVQAKVAKEVEAVIGRSRLPTTADKDKMPYTSATMLELFRVTSVIPIAPRKLHKDATFGPYKIPKDTTVFPNLWSIANDETMWDNPRVFRPERFLDGNGNVVNEDKILPFSSGKRNCIGETVARSTFFILLSGLLQQYEFEINPAEPTPSLEPELGITLMPKPFTFVVKNRH